MGKTSGMNNNAKELTCEILELLRQRTDKDHPISATKLKELLDVRRESPPDAKTVSRTLRTLREHYAGPGKVICQETEKKNGDLYGHGYYLDRDFSAEEVEMLINDVMFSRMRTQEQAKELIDKLKSLVSPYQRKELAYGDFLPFSLYTANELVQQNIAFVQRIISANLHNKTKERVISFCFNGYGSDHKLHETKKFRGFLPLKLIESYGSYYVVGLVPWDSKPWNFRLDLMTRLSSRERNRPEDARREQAIRTAAGPDALSVYPTQHLYMAGEREGEPVETVELRVEKIFYKDERGEKVYYKPLASMTLLHDTFGENYKVVFENDRYVDIRVKGVLWGITSFVRQYIDRVRVIGPEDVKARVEESLRKDFEGYFSREEEL